MVGLLSGQTLSRREDARANWRGSGGVKEAWNDAVGVEGAMGGGQRVGPDPVDARVYALHRGRRRGAGTESDEEQKRWMETRMPSIN